MVHILFEVFLNSVLISGLVVIMMMMIECFNVWSKGRLAVSLGRRGFPQIALSAFLGSIPGCMGGFAVVSMYTHGLVSFGALVAMMIASSGDEAFVMLAMIPDKAWWIFLGLFVLSVIVGLLVDVLSKGKGMTVHCSEDFAVHNEDDAPSERHLSLKRVILFLGVAAFAVCLATGVLEHEHGAEDMDAVHGGINLLSEDWMNVMFACLSVLVLAVLVFSGDHFVDGHLWHHVVVKHLPSIFAWTFGTLLVIESVLGFFDISQWISENTALMILLAAAVGIIPESGPHMLFVTLYAAGIVPLPVIVASCISQDGHAALPLLAESKRGFVSAKTVNFLIAVAIGFILTIFQ